MSRVAAVTTDHRGKVVQAERNRQRSAKTMLGAMAFAVALNACDSQRGRQTDAVEAVQWPSVTQAEGLELIEKYECHRCHAGTGHDDPEPAKDCAGCHQDIAHGRFTVPIEGGQRPDAETLAEWAKHTQHLIHVPNLEGAAARLRRDWLVEFLLEPSDVRPVLEETMPRLRIEKEDVSRLAAYLTRAPKPDRAKRGFANRGRRLLEEKGCTACHQFTGVPALKVAPAPAALSPDELDATMALAPDLRHARERMTAATLVEWIVDPEAVQPDTLMPKLEVTRKEAAHMVAYITTAQRSPRRPNAPVQRLPLLKRPVSFTEASEKAFRGSCWHCHSDPDYAFGDGGPGNTGGFGFAGRGVQLATYDGVLSGYVDAEGERQSLLETASGKSVLVESLLARHDEQAGHPRDDVLGMPLGLPALGAEQIQLVESWVEQGVPR